MARLLDAAGRILGAGALAAALTACSTPAPTPRSTQAPPGESPAQAPPHPQGAPQAPPPAPTEPPVPVRKALLMEGGRETWIDVDKAVAAGYTLLDLSDDWTPYIFAPHQTPTGELLPNRYRRVFVGLANDRLDEDGQPLQPGEKNYLELYGVFPSLSVIRARFLEDAARTCDRPAPQNPKRKRPPPSAMSQAEHRLTCEGFLKPAARHKTGKLDDPMRRAIRAFQQKHMIYEGHGLQPRTREALERPLVDNDHRSLMRALRERVISAAGVVEDGTASGKVPVRNLAEELTATVVQQLGLDTPEQALAFFQRHPAGDFTHLMAAVKLPAPPEYYGPQMDLSIVIDRGDVWYDLPFDETGAYKPHGRKKYPMFNLLVNHKGQKILLARWRTTIGGWRAEQASDGYEYFRYKGSDVGPRVMRNIVAGPVWIAPASTPIRSLVKGKLVRGSHQPVVNYEELGPGYLSAYGLVAGYIVTPGKEGRGDFDNGIRLHGSAEYLSMYSANGFSHGCHRLPNHLAIRLYSFLLKHRSMRIVGDQPMDFARQFLKGNDAFEIRIASRGYSYQMDPPLPIEVLEGEIKGEVKNPIVTYVPKPGVVYPGPPPPAPNSAESRAGGAAGPARVRGNADEEEEKP